MKRDGSVHLNLRLDPSDNKIKKLLFFRLVVRFVIKSIPQFKGQIARNLIGKLNSGVVIGNAISRTVHQQQRQWKLTGVIKRPLPGAIQEREHADRDFVVA